MQYTRVYKTSLKYYQLDLRAKLGVRHKPVGSNSLLSAVAKVGKKLHLHRQPNELEIDQRHPQVHSHRFLPRTDC